MHPAARRLLERLAAGPDLLLLFWPTIMGYLRTVTHPAILPQPLPAPAAVANVAELIGLPHVRTPSEGTRFWETYRATADDRAAGNLVPDAHLVSLMREHGVGTVFSRDRDLRRFEGIAVTDPFAG